MLRTSGPPASFIFYAHPLARLVDFLLGISLFHIYSADTGPVWSRTQGTIAEAASILALVLFLSLRNDVPVFWRYSAFYWLPVTALIYVFAKGAGWLSTLLRGDIPVFLGEISYAFYLIQTPTRMLLQIGFRRLHLTPSPAAAIGVFFLCTLAGSLFLHIVIDRPLTRLLRHRLIDRRGRA